VVCVVDEYGGVCEDVVGPIPGVFVEEFEDVGRAGDPCIPGVGVVVVDLECYRTCIVADNVNGAASEWSRISQLNVAP
jgi:hypothetical protein